jgi:spermidine/putrescine transport system ATP-binding protein/putrescine transport system ATP-binding protein
MTTHAADGPLTHHRSQHPVTPEAGPLLRVAGLTRSFGATPALDDVSLEIRRNEFFALLGPSGCGKTTLLRVIAGFEQPDSGSVLLRDADLLALPPHRRPVNLMFQSYALFPHLSVERNVAYGLEREGVAKNEVRRRVGEVLDTVGLTALARRRPSQLSGGQRQRVALARAIVKRPQLLLLDEPLSALDRKVRAEMQLELKRLQHEVGITFVVVTHDQEEAMSMADRIAVLAGGRVQQVATPQALYERPANLFVADFVGTSNIFAGDAAAGGVRTRWGLLPGTAEIDPGAGAAHVMVRPEHVRLVDVDRAILGGQVIDTQFYGGTSTVAIEIEGRDEPVLHTHPGMAPVRRGDIVHLAWDQAHGVVLAS